MTDDIKEQTPKVKTSRDKCSGSAYPNKNPKCSDGVCDKACELLPDGRSHTWGPNFGALLFQAQATVSVFRTKQQQQQQQLTWWYQ